jgi:hypothetical protein
VETPGEKAKFQCLLGETDDELPELLGGLRHAQTAKMLAECLLDLPFSIFIDPLSIGKTI